eukprot:1464867-Pleurochrysis_carterae.AAC.3
MALRDGQGRRLRNGQGRNAASQHVRLSAGESFRLRARFRNIALSIPRQESHLPEEPHAKLARFDGACGVTMVQVCTHACETAAPLVRWRRARASNGTQ